MVPFQYLKGLTVSSGDCGIFMIPATTARADLCKLLHRLPYTRDWSLNVERMAQRKVRSAG